MFLLTKQLKAFNTLAPRAKAQIIGALCGAFGVLAGIVLYIVFTHLNEQGTASNSVKLAGVIGGLLIAIAIATFADKLRETIETGDARLSFVSGRPLIAVVSLVIVFELSSFAFEDFVHALAGDFRDVRNIAADIAGRSNAEDVISLTDPDAGKLFARLKSSMGKSCTPEARLVSLMPRKTLIAIFPEESAATDTEIEDLFGPLCGSALLPLEAGQIVFPTRPQAAEACRALLKASDKTRPLKAALRSLMGRHDLYDAKSFTVHADDQPLEISPSLRASLAVQRKNCDDIRTFATNQGINVDAASTCTAIAQKLDNRFPANARVLTEAGIPTTLLPVSEMKSLNHELLAAAFPGIVAPVSVYWWDFILLFLVWCTSAMILGVILSNTVFELVDSTASASRQMVQSLRAGVWALLATALASTLTVMLIRLVQLLINLALDPDHLDIARTFYLFDLVPTLVLMLHASGVPAWLSLGCAVAIPLLMIRFGKADGLRTIGQIILVGLVVLSIRPVALDAVDVILRATGAWLVPAFGLLMLLPYLKPGRDVPQWWGVIGLFGGITIALWTLTFIGRGSDVVNGLNFMAGVIVAATSRYILRRVPLHDLWPLVALTVALTLLGVTLLFENVTFAGVLSRVHSVSHEAKPPSEGFDIGKIAEKLNGLETADEVVPEAFVNVAREGEAVRSVNLEVALTGSLGFWLTIAILAAWSLRQKEVAPPAPIPDRERL